MNGRIRVLLALIMTLGLAFGPARNIRPAAAETTVITLTIGNGMITVYGQSSRQSAAPSNGMLRRRRSPLPQVQ
jgi:hypothetical protein